MLQRLPRRTPKQVYCVGALALAALEGPAMTSHEFVRAQAVLKLKNRDLEGMFGVSDQTIVNWRKGYSRVPGAVAWAIRTMLEQAKTEL
jgi:DNA-binding transcriptional regulator YiaG